jgi:hypothetical protein
LAFAWGTDECVGKSVHRVLGVGCHPNALPQAERNLNAYPVDCKERGQGDSGPLFREQWLVRITESAKDLQIDGFC